MSWTGKQRERLTVEKNILDKYFQSCITWISPACSVNAKIDAFIKCNSGTQYTLRVYIPHDFPNSCPNVVFKEPESRIPADFQDKRNSYTRNYEGYLLIRLYDKGEWTSAVSLYQVLMKGQLWLEGYEVYLRTGHPIDNFVARKSQ